MHFSNEKLNDLLIFLSFMFYLIEWQACYFHFICPWELLGILLFLPIWNPVNKFLKQKKIQYYNHLQVISS